MLKLVASTMMVWIVTLVSGCGGQKINLDEAHTNNDQISQRAGWVINVDDTQTNYLVPECDLSADDAGNCTVSMYDGTNLVPANLADSPNQTAETPKSGVAVFYSAPGYEPQIVIMQDDQQLPNKVILKRGNSRLSYVAGVVVEKAEASKTIKFIAGENVYIARARARQTLQTDQQGRFVTALPAGHYLVNAGGVTHEIDVKRGQTKILPIEIEHRN